MGLIGPFIPSFRAYFKPHPAPSKDLPASSEELPAHQWHFRLFRLLGEGTLEYCTSKSQSFSHHWLFRLFELLRENTFECFKVSASFQNTLRPIAVFLGFLGSSEKTLLSTYKSQPPFMPSHLCKDLLDKNGKVVVTALF